VIASRLPSESRKKAHPQLVITHIGDSMQAAFEENSTPQHDIMCLVDIINFVINDRPGPALLALFWAAEHQPQPRAL
jgi:hypothetical protein